MYEVVLFGTCDQERGGKQYYCMTALGGMPEGQRMRGKPKAT